MKATVYVADERLRAIELRAVREGQRLNIAGALLRAGRVSGRAPAHVVERAMCTRDKQMSLPRVQCPRAARGGAGLMVLLTVAAVCVAPVLRAADVESKAPYPASTAIAHVHWDWATLQSAAPGSDLWPVTWLADDSLLCAWGDGGGFGGTDREGRVALGFARLDGTPPKVAGVNVNGGVKALHPASYPRHGKVGGLLAIDNRVYAWLNAQDGAWPDVDEVLIVSDDHGATWRETGIKFPKGKGNLKPATFLNVGRGYAGVPEALKGYAYFYGQRQGEAEGTYLGRAPVDKLADRGAYAFFTGETEPGRAAWTADPSKANPVFSDPAGTGDLATVVYVPALRRYLLTTFHKGPGQLGIFDAPQPWGPWTTVAYYEKWGEMAADGEGLTCTFPSKWVSPDGQTLWCVFSAYGEGAKRGIAAHDRFNLVKVELKLAR